MTTKTPVISRLHLLKKGQSARIVAITGNKQVVKQMRSLGLRVGSTVNMLNARGSSVVIQNAGTRMAIGPGMIEKLQIELVDTQPKNK